MKIEKWKLVRIVIALVVVVFALTIGISVYSATPENRLSRQLNLGQKYLEDGEYEAAALAFENAIEIDGKCMEAYAGGIDAYLLMDDKDKLLVFYDRALSEARNLDENFLEQDIDFIVEIYLAADKVYSDDLEQKMILLEEGWNFTGNVQIKEKLIVEYLAIAEKKVKTEDYEGGLEIFDRLLEMSKDDERVLESLEKCLNVYLECLLEEGKYDEVRRIAEKYRAAVTGIDFDGILKQTEEKEAQEKEIALKQVEEEREQEIQEVEAEAEDVEDEEEFEDGEGAVTETIPLSGNWVDDLYQKIIAEDVDAVFAIMEQPDFLEKCEEFPHSEVVWSIDYSLLTSDGKIFWVLKSINYDMLYITCIPNLDVADSDVGGAALDGEYTFSITGGAKQFFKGDYSGFHV